MTTPISGATAGASAGSATSGTDSTAGGALGKDAFLQLLVASMKYQDPSKPVDSQQYIAQLAQFAQVEKLNSIDSTQTELARWQRTVAGQGMLGATVTGKADDGTATSGEIVTGTVTGVTLTSTGARLSLSTGRTLDVTDVTSVSDTHLTT